MKFGQLVALGPGRKRLDFGGRFFLGCHGNRVMNITKIAKLPIARLILVIDNLFHFLRKANENLPYKVIYAKSPRTNDYIVTGI